MLLHYRFSTTQYKLYKLYKVSNSTAVKLYTCTQSHVLEQLMTYPVLKETGLCYNDHNEVTKGHSQQPGSLTHGLHTHRGLGGGRSVRSEEVKK